jgi:hypothetical protein
MLVFFSHDVQVRAKGGGVVWRIKWKRDRRRLLWPSPKNKRKRDTRYVPTPRLFVRVELMPAHSPSSLKNNLGPAAIGYFWENVRRSDRPLHALLYGNLIAQDVRISSAKEVDIESNARHFLTRIINRSKWRETIQIQVTISSSCGLADTGRHLN